MPYSVSNPGSSSMTIAEL